MDILYFLIPLSMIVMGIMIWAVIWTVRSGQYDDLEGPAHRILMDDDDPRIPHPVVRTENNSDQARGEPAEQTTKTQDRSS